jgi:putative RNA 2'-phosphotransferase
VDGRERASRMLSYWLRHRPDAAGLELSDDGWAELARVIEALGREGATVSEIELRAVLSAPGKQRFELDEAGLRIRAREGHTVAVRIERPTPTPPERLYHGTVLRSLPSIRRQGLTPRGRTHVHLSESVEEAVAVARRRGAPVILEVRACELAAHGVRLERSSSGVWLAERVPPELVSVMRGD